MAAPAPAVRESRPLQMAGDTLLEVGRMLWYCVRSFWDRSEWCTECSKSYCIPKSEYSFGRIDRCNAWSHVRADHDGEFERDCITWKCPTCNVNLRAGWF